MSKTLSNHIILYKALALGHVVEDLDDRIVAMCEDTGRMTMECTKISKGVESKIWLDYDALNNMQSFKSWAESQLTETIIAAVYYLGTIRR